MKIGCNNTIDLGARVLDLVPSGRRFIVVTTDGLWRLRFLPLGFTLATRLRSRDRS